MNSSPTGSPSPVNPAGTVSAGNPSTGLSLRLLPGPELSRSCASRRRNQNRLVVERRVHERVKPLAGHRGENVPAERLLLQEQFQVTQLVDRVAEHTHQHARPCRGDLLETRMSLSVSPGVRMHAR
jgi:hypothetical protein